MKNLYESFHIFYHHVLNVSLFSMRIRINASPRWRRSSHGARARKKRGHRATVVNHSSVRYGKQMYCQLKMFFRCWWLNSMFTLYATSARFPQSMIWANEDENVDRWSKRSPQMFCAHFGRFGHLTKSSKIPKRFLGMIQWPQRLANEFAKMCKDSRFSCSFGLVWSPKPCQNKESIPD